MTSICTGYTSRPRSSTATRSIASYTRRNEPKSQFGPLNSGTSALSCAAFKLLSTHAPLCKEFVEYREYLRRVAAPPHREMRMRRRHLIIGAPQIAVAGQSGQAAAETVTDFDISKILAQRQDIVAEQRYATAGIGTVIVAVRGLRAVNVPAIGRIARTRDFKHFFQ